MTKLCKRCGLLRYETSGKDGAKNETTTKEVPLPTHVTVPIDELMQLRKESILFRQLLNERLYNNV